MPLILMRIGIIIATSLSSFTAGLQLDFSQHVTWLHINPNMLGSQVIQQSLEGTIDDYFARNAFLHKTTLDLVSRMTPEQKAGQLLMPAWEKGTSLDEMISIAKTYHVGGIMVLRNDATIGDTTVLIAATDAHIGSSTLHPLLSVDAEPSLVQYRIPQANYTKKTSNIRTTEYAYTVADEIAHIIEPYGYNLNFAPVYDSNNNTNVISDRSFGRTTEDIIPLANSFAQGMKDHMIIPTAKHFPGHGYAQGDTHLSLQSVPGDLPELANFESAVNAKLPVFMVGHLAINGGEYDTKGLPSTLSATSTDMLLRDTLGYKGVVITDAMTMGALNGMGDVDMLTLAAGSDIVLMPRNMDATFNTLVSQIRNDEEYEKEINEKLYRIVRLKLVQQWAR